jgi:hypothetical protein
MFRIIVLIICFAAIVGVLGWQMFAQITLELEAEVARNFKHRQPWQMRKRQGRQTYESEPSCTSED